MKFHVLKFSVLLFMLAFFCSCSLETTGNSLFAFNQRLNELYSSETFSESGYILDQKKCTLTQFYKFNDNEIMLQFVYNEKNELKTMNIAAGPEDLNNEECFSFVKKCISAFINDPKSEDLLLNETDFENAVKIKDIHTRQAKNSDTELLLDVTEIGTVITVVQNNL